MNENVRFRVHGSSSWITRLSALFVFMPWNCLLVFKFNLFLFFSRENKNRFVFAFLKSLINCGMFEHIYLNFLPVGHTHCDIDQLFSRIAIWMRGTAHFDFQCVALALALMNCL